VRYRLLQGSAVLAVRPFVTGRDYHGIHRYNQTFNTAIERHEDSGTHITLRPYEGCPPIVWSHDGEWYEGGTWYHSFEYAVEQERGLDFVEDAWCPGAWVWRLNEACPNATWVIGTEPSSLSESSASHAREVARLHGLQSSTRKPDDAFVQRLALAADQVRGAPEDGLHTVLAGYPWFSDWGRDTMIALPGLCISTGRFDIARFYSAGVCRCGFRGHDSQSLSRCRRHARL
jgi:predicted glycogen debranching enzyme